MSDVYTKLFRTMFTGSMFGAGCHVFATWMWVLSHADERGLVEVNARLVASELGASIEQIQQAIDYLTAPDPESRTPDEEGRRMVRVGQFGYRIVNHGKYRQRGADRSAYWREYKRRQRTNLSTVDNVDNVDNSTISTHAEANANAEAKANAEANAKKPVKKQDRTGETDSKEPAKNPKEPEAEGTPTGKPPTAAQTKITFNAEANRFVGVPEARIMAWSEAYPTIDIEQEIIRAATWYGDNPKRRKKDIGRFLGNWISRASSGFARASASTSTAPGEIAAPARRGPDGLTARERALQGASR